MQSNKVGGGGVLGNRLQKPASPDNLSTFDGGVASQILSTKQPLIERKDIARSIYLEKELK